MSIVRRLLSSAILSCGASCAVAGLGSEGTPETLELRPVEASPSAVTIQLLDELFRSSEEIEVRLVKFQEIELRGYEPRVEKMPYAYLYRCGNFCTRRADKLRVRLSTARRADADCPWITGALIFRGAASVELKRILVGAGGHCIVIDNAPYVLDHDQSLEYVFSSASSVF